MTRTAIFGVLALLSGCGGGFTYVTYAKQQLAAGNPGQAMVALDAAADADPANRSVASHRRKAAAAWVREQAAKLREDPNPERAFDLLNTVASVGRSRGAKDAVDEAVAPALDKVVLRMWPGPKVPTDAPGWWSLVWRGEGLTANLPHGSGARRKLDELRGQAAAFHLSEAGRAKHPGAVWFHHAMAARYRGATVAVDVVKALGRVAMPGYKLQIQPSGPCGPEAARSLEAKLAEAPIFASHGGVPVTVTLRLKCTQPTGHWRTQKQMSWVEHETTRHSHTACRQGALRQTGQRDVYAPGPGRKMIGWVTTYQSVPECKTQTVEVTKAHNVSDLVTVDVKEVGFVIDGIAVFADADTDHVFPLDAKMVGKAITASGARYGNRERLPPDLAKYGYYLAHAIWLELLYARAEFGGVMGKMAAGRAEAAARRGDANDALGWQVVATKLLEKLNQQQAAFFEQRFGLSAQHARECLLGVARVAASPPEPRHKLEMPRLDPTVTARVKAEKKPDSGGGY